MPLLQSQRTLRGVLKMMIDAAVAEHRVAPALHRVFAEELPRSARPRDVSRHDDIAAEWKPPIERFLKNVPNTDLAMFLCRVVTHAAIHEAATERPDLLDDPLFADEIVTLLERYLRRSA
jgi:hypothetical protein